MIQLNLNVSGQSTDQPSLVVDMVPAVYLADLSVPRRAVFQLPDSTPPHGLTVRWDGQEVRSVVPQSPGSYEGGLMVPPLPDLTYGALVVKEGPLRAEGSRFMMGDKRWVARLHSDFRDLKKWMEGESNTEVEAQRKDAGSDGPRVFGSCSNLFKLDPRNYPNYYSRLTDFAKYQADRGACWEYVAYTDRQITGLGDDHWARSCEALAEQPGLLMQLVNEHFKNGVDPRQFRPIPNGVPQCPGSFVDGMGPPVSPMWPGGYNAFNPLRSWKWPVTVGVTVWELYTYAGGLATLLIDEPIGADEVPFPGRRASDPVLFEKMAVDCSLWAAGGVFHSQAGLVSGLWGPVQTACAEHFFRGLGR